MFEFRNDIIRISVRDLVEFVCNSGDIDNRTGSGRDVKAMQKGAAMHRKLQKEYGKGYKAEVSLKTTVEQERYSLLVEGRADGILTRDEKDAAVDEIKCIYADIDKLQEPVPVHLAQAMCYAYMYADMMELDTIEVMMTYCQLDTDKVRIFKSTHSYTQLKEWFEGLVEKFRKWTDFYIDWYDIRQKSIDELKFPYEYRPGQKVLAGNVYKAVEQNEVLYIQAPTGTGKTISTIYPAVKAMGMDMADKLFYLTAKTITRTVAVDTFELLKDAGLEFRYITITARDKICPKENRACNPVECEFAKGHYDRVNEAVFDMVSHEKSINAAIVSEYAIKHSVCPFEMSLDATYWCDGIICDYNYVFDPNVYLRRFFGEGLKEDYIFLVDEAHNLVERGRRMYSATLIKEDFLECRRMVKEIDKNLAAALEKCNRILLDYKKTCETYQVQESAAAFNAAVDNVYYRMQAFFENHKNFPYMDRFSEIYLKVRHYVNITELYDERYVCYTSYDSENQFLITLYCVDPSFNLKSRMDKGVASVLFSATLLPINYYKEMLTGDEQDKATYAKSVFDNRKRCVLIGSDVSSKFTRRNFNEYKKVAEYIVNVTSCRSGNYMVFFPAFSYMQSVLDYMNYYCKDYMDRTQVMVQRASMSEAEREAFLEEFAISDGSCKVGMCVLGGIFSEGIDLKDDALIGAIIVGTGIPYISDERQLLRGYFDAHDKNGYSYAYTYPGINKVFQAAGRVIRTVRDVGVVVLLDERFLNSEYRNLFPREWDDLKCCTRDSVSGYLEEFWKKTDSME